MVPVLLDYKLHYPGEAMEQGLEGIVWVRVYVGKDGKAKDAKIEKSSGNYLLDSAAVRTAKTFTFSPTMSGDKKIESRVLVPIEFKLKEVHPEFWLTEVKVLQKMIENQYNKEWIIDLYERYKEMIYTPIKSRDLELNQYIKQAVLDTTAKLWEGFWISYPANILLFVDIINRYPESFTRLEAQADFNNYFKNEKIRIRHSFSQPLTDTLVNRLSKAVGD